MLYCAEHSFLMFSNESTGSRSVYTTLRDLYGAVDYSHKHTHTPIPDGCSEYLPLVTCREPFNRLVSAYNRIIKQPYGDAYYGYGVQWNTFREFLACYAEWFDSPETDPEGNTFHWCRYVRGNWMVIPWPQIMVLAEITSQCKQPPVFLRTENLQNDIDALPFYRGERLPVIGKSEYNLDDFRNESNIRIVSDVLAPEYSAFGYSL